MQYRRFLEEFKRFFQNPGLDVEAIARSTKPAGDKMLIGAESYGLTLQR